MNHGTTAVDRYVEKSLASVQGYLTTLDARVVAALLSLQLQKQIAGHLCEIGVHHGRLFLMLALARRAGERALAIDLFEDDAINTNTQHAGRDRALFRNARRLGIEFLEEEVWKTSSFEVQPSQILKRTTGRIRFFSVDGCHLYDAVENDLNLAEGTLGDEGIIAIDDFFNVDWADVSFATSDFLRRAKGMRAFAITSSKLFVAPAAAAEKYLSALRGRPGLGRLSTVQIMGRDVLALRQGTLKKGYEAIRELLAKRAS